MKACKFVLLGFAELVCACFLIAMCMTPRTKTTALARVRHHKEPTLHNLDRLEQAERRDQTFLWSMRASLALALALNSWMIVRVAKRKETDTPAANKAVEATT